MTDYSELKRMAEAAIKSGAENGERWPQDDDWFEPERYGAELEYVKSISPAAVLALIADLEEARDGMKHSCAIRLKKEIERLQRESGQLKTEVEALRKDAERYRWLKSMHWFEVSLSAYGDVFRDDGDLDSAIDAAMGKEVKTK